MKRLQLFSVISVIALLLSFSSCQIVGGIFKAGVWAGVLMVVVVVGFVIYLISRAGGR